MHSEGINAGEMKHGPLALVDDKLPIIVIATMDSMHNKMQGVIQQLMARSARLIIVCNEEDDDMEEIVGGKYPLIKVPRVDEALQPVANIIPMQLLSYHLTLMRGYNVDQPRNLAKSVTVTEEVGAFWAAPVLWQPALRASNDRPAWGGQGALRSLKQSHAVYCQHAQPHCRPRPAPLLAVSKRWTLQPRLRRRGFGPGPLGEAVHCYVVWAVTVIGDLEWVGLETMACGGDRGLAAAGRGQPRPYK